MFFKIAKYRGESLLETVIATVVLVAVLTTTFALLNRGISSNVNVKNRVIAINLAREGIEAVRNIRDTNWLKYSGDRRGKWLCAETIDWTPPYALNSPTDNCSSGVVFEVLKNDGFYIVDFFENEQRYFLKEITDLDAAFELNLEDDSRDWKNYLLYTNDTYQGRFTHDPKNETSDNARTIFYRQIELRPRSEDVCGGNGCTEERLEVISRVQWEEGEGKNEAGDTVKLIREVVLETHLYDFYERDAY